MERELDLVDEARAPAPWRLAAIEVARCIGRSIRLLLRHEVRWPRTSVGTEVHFADGSTGRVYRETALDLACSEPVVLVVGFRLRHVRGRGHAWFRAESILNTPLFVAFTGFRSKLWLAADASGRYRGIYQWDGADAAHAYARALWRVLQLVCEPSSIDYRVLRGCRRDSFVNEGGDAAGEWWQVPSGSADDRAVAGLPARGERHTSDQPPAVGTDQLEPVVTAEDPSLA